MNNNDVTTWYKVSYEKKSYFYEIFLSYFFNLFFLKLNYLTHVFCELIILWQAYISLSSIRIAHPSHPKASTHHAKTKK